MNRPSARRRRGLVQLLFLVAGAIFLLGALLNNTWCAAMVVRAARALLHRPGIAEPDVARVHAAQLIFLLAGLGLVAIGVAVGRLRPVDSWLRNSRVEKVFLGAFAVAVPVLWLELSLRAFVPRHEKTTTIFVRDDTLGWKLRAGASDMWGGVPVVINERGFRGPVLPLARTPGTRRIVYLGDSVTFGYRVARWEDTYPFQAGELLAARDSIPTETVNLAVEGYSQWQQLIVLREEGLPYQPDLVVLGFVLNDVTEMFHLDRFGGSDEGYQLRHSYTSRWDRILSRSALVYEVRNFAREVKARRKLGADVRLGAIKQEQLDVETLIHAPEQANVKAAWEFALADLHRIADLCASRQVPLLVVVFPFAMQLDDPDRLSAPQRTLLAFASHSGIHCIDLLPALHEYAGRNALSSSDLFVDHDHLSVRGHRVVAELMADSLATLARP